MQLYRKYLLCLLLVIYAFNFADRLAVGVALQGIKATLHLSDTELGLLTGIAFAVFYALMGIPIARWADRGDRITVIGLTVSVWSVMVALTGRAVSFTQLLLVRMGVAVGDAGAVPAAQSLIPDYFSRHERPRASAVFLMGWPTALLLGYFIAGWVNQFYGWRTMFLIIGLPGLVIAAIAWFTLEEPRFLRPGRPPEASADAAVHPSLKEVLFTLRKNATYRNLLACCAVSAFFTFGQMQWQPAFFMRSFGLDSGEVGTWLTITLGIGSLLSIYVGGAIASRYAGNNERLQFKVAAIAYLFCGVDYAVTYLSHNAYLAFSLLGIGTLITAAGGPLFAAIQTVVPSRMRAMSYAILSLATSLIGLGLGPLTTGALSDVLRPIFGRDSLRYGLLALCPGFAWSAWYLWRASATVDSDLAAVSGES